MNRIWNVWTHLNERKIGFKNTVFRLKVEMTFNSLHNESNTKCSVVEIHQWLKMHLLHVIMKLKSIYYFTYSLKIPLCTAEWNLAHTWIMVMMRLELRTLLFLKRNKIIFAIWIAKTVWFPMRNQRWNLGRVKLL